jgi:hypothetical protein
MKTTLEIPDLIFRRAKAVAAERGIPLRALVSEALADKLRAQSNQASKPWMSRSANSAVYARKRRRLTGSLKRNLVRLNPRTGFEGETRSHTNAHFRVLPSSFTVAD